jgi:hypothetical protein
MMNKTQLNSIISTISPPRLLIRFICHPNTLALLFFLLLTAILLRPVIFHFFDQVSGVGDTYEYAWRLWWIKHTLIDTAQSIWFVPYIYYPHGYPFAYSEVTPTNTFFGLPFTLAFGEFSAHNALLFINILLTAFTTFLLAHQLTRNWWASLLAGILFGFSPFRRGQYFHINHLTLQWFPLIFLFLERFLRTGHRKYAFAGGVACGLNALASWYIALAGGLLSLVWVADRARPWSNYLKQQRFWTGVVIFTLTSLIFIIPFVLPFLEVTRDPDTQPPLENVNFWSASLTDYLIPNPFHPIWGTFVEEKFIPLATLVDKESPTQTDFEEGRFFPNSNLNISTEFLLSPGLVALLFAFYSLRWTPSKLTRPWLYLIIVSVVLSFGPTVHLAGRQLIFPVSPAVAAAYNQIMNYISSYLALKSEPFTLAHETGILIPLPALFLRWFVPGLDNARTWTRFGQFAIFGVAILAAYGASAWYHREIAQRRKKRSWRIEGKELKNYPPSTTRFNPFSTFHFSSTWPWLVVIALALFELWWKPMPTSLPSTERPVDVWLRQQPGHEALIQYPLESSFNGVQFFYTRAHGKPIAHGYGNFFGFMFGRRHPELLTFPDPASLATLTRWSVRYVLIETQGPGTDTAQTLLQQVSTVSCLQPATIQGSIHVFELIGCKNP